MLAGEFVVATSRDRLRVEQRNIVVGALPGSAAIGRVVQVGACAHIETIPVEVDNGVGIAEIDWCCQGGR